MSLVYDVKCAHCKFYRLSALRFLEPWPHNLCDLCAIMRIKNPQRFGKLKQSFGDFGELRQQKRAPQLEVFYIPLRQTKQKEPVYRSVNNCTSDQLTEFIRMVGKHMEAGAIQQTNAEIVLDHCYAELNKRVNGKEENAMG